ncbi:hypothetical protein KY290_009793 [Solanum tuberosum]|uniref:Uncharacterized protein n=1 Tax=Solanum tuberosum TaxID=4113 RepID=A0ABQ7VVX3_SOLTU|nr:hypothetical protein KY289_010174 [Solanum tuberosum]KAH0772656.1 hypothetical protein KY290_009793 [Solanum tuberosum]
MASLFLSKFSFFPLLIIIALFFHSSHCDVLTKCRIKSLFQFGDSLADAGNVIRIPGAVTLAKAWGLPYGETFFHKPTGRFTDGRIIADYIASALNLPFVNAYLDKSGVSFSQGANFAVAGATAMNNSFLVEKGIGFAKYNVPLPSQLEWFKSHLQSTCGSKCARTLRNSLVVLGEFGGVDYWNAFAGAGTKSEPEVRTYVPLIIDGIMSAIKDVIQLGSTRILVPGVLPFGCLSGYLTRFPNTNPDAYDQFGCLKSYNKFAMYHNTELKKALENLQCEFPRVKIVYGDYYGGFRFTFRNANWLGFNPNTLVSACCGSGGRYNTDGGCGGDSTNVCPNPSQYVNWDGLHLTDEAYHRISDVVINNMLPKFGCCGLGNSSVLSSY